jgi:predicted dithiol-disulfide oxidoreductase (DUF899 family)
MTAATPVVSREEWAAARVTLLAAEKELTHQRDRLSAAQRALPWVEVTAPYLFTTVDGKKTLGDLFDGRSQLIVYHFMFGPEWEEGCPSCSFWADNYNGTEAHLAARDTTLIAVSRAPLASLLAYRQRMGWSFSWVSSLGSSFNHDFGVSFADTYNYAPVDRIERLRPPREPGVPHVQLLRARSRHLQLRIRHARRHPERTRRGRSAVDDGLAASS